MKKKGLIISTIVMVLVLAVSLSTATFAWFSTQATATVTDLNINTKASEGLQIAMVNGSITSRHSGQLEYTDAGWLGDVEDWGNQLNLTNINIGQMEDAVTKIAAGTAMSDVTAKFQGKEVSTGYKALKAADTQLADADVEALNGAKVYIATPIIIGSPPAKPDGAKHTFKYGTHYSKIGAEAIATDTKFTLTPSDPSATDGATDAAKTVYTFEETSDPTATITGGKVYCLADVVNWDVALDAYLTADKTALAKDAYLVPVSYDGTVPTAFKLATANNHYYYLTMAVMNTKLIEELGLSIQIQVGGSNASMGAFANANPGMASASRMDVIVSPAKEDSSPDADNAVSKSEAPFSAYRLENQTMSSKTFAEITASGKNDGVTGTIDANNLNSTGKYAYKLHDNSMLAVNSVYYVTLLLYIEGEDPECQNITTGTEMTFSINFGYADVGASINWESPDYFSDGAFTGTAVQMWK